VKGIYESGSPDFDRAIAYSSMDCVRKIGALNGYHEIVILLPDDDWTQTIRARIQTLFAPPIDVTIWDEAQPRMANSIKLNQGFLGLIMGILFLVITLGVANTLLVSVFERTREFGLMAALGTRPNQTLSVILVETALIALGSTCVGVLLAMIAIGYYKQVGFDVTPFTGATAQIGLFRIERHIHPYIDWKSNLKSLGLMCTFILIAGIFPAVRSVRMKPTEAMRSL
jgi:ABC-type lipoprotein release transport system permease subunit